METRLNKMYAWQDGSEHEALNIGYRAALKDVIKFAKLKNINQDFINELVNTLEDI